MNKDLLNEYPEIRAAIDGSLALYLSYGLDKDFIPVGKLVPAGISFVRNKMINGELGQEFIPIENGKITNKQRLLELVEKGDLEDCKIVFHFNDNKISILAYYLEPLMELGAINYCDWGTSSKTNAFANNRLANNTSAYVKVQGAPIEFVSDDYDLSKNYRVVPFYKKINKNKVAAFNHSER